jgi:hypothetical protein
MAITPPAATGRMRARWSVSPKKSFPRPRTIATTTAHAPTIAVRSGPTTSDATSGPTIRRAMSDRCCPAIRSTAAMAATSPRGTRSQRSRWRVKVIKRSCPSPQPAPARRPLGRLTSMLSARERPEYRSPPFGARKIGTVQRVGGRRRRA